MSEYRLEEDDDYDEEYEYMKASYGDEIIEKEEWPDCGQFYTPEKKEE